MCGCPTQATLESVSKSENVGFFEIAAILFHTCVYFHASLAHRIIHPKKQKCYIPVMKIARLSRAFPYFYTHRSSSWKEIYKGILSVYYSVLSIVLQWWYWRHASSCMSITTNFALAPNHSCTDRIVWIPNALEHSVPFGNRLSMYCHRKRRRSTHWLHRIRSENIWG